MKIYDYSVVIGRFQHFHIGHEYLVNKALKYSKKVLILVYCSKIRDKNNPFKKETVLDVINSIYLDNDNIIIKTIENNDNKDWGVHVLNIIKKHIKDKSFIIFYGKDNKRKKWFRKDELKKIKTIEVNTNIVNISATDIRRFLKNDEFKIWKKYVNEKIFIMYNYLKKEIF